MQTTMMKRPGLRALYIGFGLVIALLATASVMGTRMATEIHDDALRLREALNSNHTAAGRPAIELQQEIEQGSEQLIRESIYLLGACLLLAGVCAVVTVRFTSRSMQRTEDQALELSRVSWHMLEGQEAAARRFSHELHDELGQSLAAVKANVVSMTPDTLAHKRADCISLVDESIRNVRELSQLLRPVILDDFGLDAGLRWLCERFGQRTGMLVDFRCNLERRLVDEVETHLFRIAQEALTNVARHSQAATVQVSLLDQDGVITLRIADDGRGFSKDRTPGIGLTAMKARASQMGGKLRVESLEGSGVCIIVTVPHASSTYEPTPSNSHSASR